MFLPPLNSILSCEYATVYCFQHSSTFCVALNCIWDHFSTAYRTYLTFYVVQDCWQRLSPSCLEDILSGYRILGQFFFQYFKDSVICFSGFHSFWQVSYNCYHCSSVCNVFFSSAYFMIFFLYHVFWMTGYYVTWCSFLYISLPGPFQAFWICTFIGSSNLQNFGQYFFKYLSGLLSFFWNSPITFIPSLSSYHTFIFSNIFCFPVLHSLSFIWSIFYFTTFLFSGFYSAINSSTEHWISDCFTFLF